MEECDDYYGCDDDIIIVTPGMAVKKKQSAFRKFPYISDRK